MKIAFITPQISRVAGGIQNTSYLFADTFPKYTKEFYAFCAKDSERVETNDANIFYSNYDQNQTFALHIDLIKNVFKENKRKRFDFTFSSLYPYGLSCYLLKRFRNVPYGIMVHGNELMNESSRTGIKNRFVSLIKKKIKKIVLQNADIIFANSSYIKDFYQKTFGEQPVAVIHPPINYISRGINGNGKKVNRVLISIGRIVERKGFQYVIEAMATLVKSMPDLKYYIAGCGPYEGQLKKLVKELSLGRNVIFLGRISEEKKTELYQECDYFIMPSYTIKENAEIEGFGIVYIEANMYGKFVIGTREGGIPDAIKEGETGMFVNARDANSIAEAVKEIYSEDFLYSTKTCIEWAEEHDADKIAHQYINEAKTICKSANKKSSRNL